MKITFFDRNLEMVQAYKKRFLGSSDINCWHGDFIDLPGEYDAIVSPANSFGFMDGGIDLAYSRYFGWHLEENVQAVIDQVHDGELLVGNAVVVSTHNKKFKALIAAPTMRVPMRIGNTVNVYLAMKAVIRMANSCGLESLAVPGLGTGVGNVPTAICAKQVAAALDQGLAKDKHTTIRGAYEFHQWLLKDEEQYEKT